MRRTALVTGASRGIGLAIAHRLARENYDLTLSARSTEALSAVAESVREFGGRVGVVAADLSDEAAIHVLAERARTTDGALDLLVLCGGIGTAGSLEDYPIRRLDKTLSVNVRASFLLVQQLLPSLRKAADRNPGLGSRVVAVASITGVVAEPDLAAYGASKAALIALCESITVAESANGVAATAISPGYVDTEMAQWVHDRVDVSTMITVDDIAELVLTITRLSRNATIPNIVVTRPGPQLWRA